MPKNMALLVGCNYPGTNAALNGCINDVWGTKNMLMQYYGFTEADITVMIDTDEAYAKPTGRNIKTKLAELVKVAQDGDVLVFHFSGHGTQVPSDDPASEEADAKDEAICPCDMNLMTDDDLRAIFAPLPKGCKFTFIADCCHSGTLLDHDAVVITGPKAGGPAPPSVDVQAIQNMLAALGAGGKRDLKNRALPFNDLLGFLTQMLGEPVTRGNVRSSMGSIFGADASVKVQEFVKYAQMAHAMYTKFQASTAGGAAAGGADGNKEGGGAAGIITALFGMCLGGGAMAGAAAGGAGGGMGGGMGGGAAAGGQEAGTMAAAAPHAGSKPTAGHGLPDEIGILITGCQDKETSADACPSGDKAKAHGALSNALHTVVAGHHTQNPGTPLTYRNLVIAVREALAKSNFTQNPCLECSLKYADTTFISHA